MEIKMVTKLYLLLNGGIGIKTQVEKMFLNSLYFKFREIQTDPCMG